MRLAGQTALYAWQKWEVHVKCQKIWIKRSLEDLGENGGRMFICGMKLWAGLDSLMIVSILIAVVKLHIP
jgi:hypothetical protein